MLSKESHFLHTSFHTVITAMQGLIDAADEHLFKGRDFKTQVRINVWFNLRQLIILLS